MRTAAVLLCLLAWFSSPAQTKRPKLFRAIVYTEPGLRTDGILYELTDSTLRFVRNTPGTIAQLRAGQVPEVFEVTARSIGKIVIRRKGHVGRGALIGGGIGAIPGALIVVGSLVESNGSLQYPLIAAFLAVTMIYSGGQWGVLVSVLPRKMKMVNRDPLAFKRIKYELLPFSYRFQESQQPEKPFAN